MLADGVVALGLKNQALQTKLVLQFLVPLLAQVGGNDDQDAATAFGPTLGDDKTGLDGFAEPNLVGQDDAAREGVLAGKERSLDLMGVEVNLRIDQSRCQRFHGIARRAPGQ